MDATLNQQAAAVMARLKNAGFDFSSDTGVPGKLWQRVSAAVCSELTTAALLSVAENDELEGFAAEITLRQMMGKSPTPAECAYMALYLFCTTEDSCPFELAANMMAYCHARQDNRAFPTPEEMKQSHAEFMAALG